MSSFVHYKNMNSNSLDIVCSNCGHKFEYGKPTPRFCPRCGERLETEKYNNIPMDIVPSGIKGWLYKNYDKYPEYYEDTWHKIITYLEVIYNPKEIEYIIEDRGLCNLVEGYAIENNKKLCFISKDKAFIGFYTNKERNKTDIEIYSVSEFKELLLKLAELKTNNN